MVLMFVHKVDRTIGIFPSKRELAIDTDTFNDFLVLEKRQWRLIRTLQTRFVGILIG